MTSSDSDSYDYENYYLKHYEEMRGPPLIKKRCRIIAAVVQDQVELLKELLDHPKWYNTRDKQTYSLLQIAIFCNNAEIFDYLLSLPNFPLEYKNKYLETALKIAIDDRWAMREHYSMELIKKGANYNISCDEDDLPLHRALQLNYKNVANFLIENGSDLNRLSYYRISPLGYALNRKDLEMTCTLLCYGAKPTMNEFEQALKIPKFHIIEEALFFHSIDDETEVTFDLILLLAKKDSKLFYKVLDFPVKENIRADSIDCFITLTTINKNYLIVILEHYCDQIKFSLKTFSALSVKFPIFYLNLENLFILLESDLKWMIIDIIEQTGLTTLFHSIEENELTCIYCYLLSYGVNVKEIDLQEVYRRFGYCTLFKILLHMEIELDSEKQCVFNIMPVFIYNMSMSIDTFIHEVEWDPTTDYNELGYHFANSEFQEMYDEVVSNICNLPDIPLLAQLARDAFRAYFIQTFSIKKSAQFYTLLKHLPISNAYKKIISYETKLYKK